MRIYNNLIFIASLLAITTPCQALINGTPLKGAADLVRLRFSNGWICSGVYIDEYTILTAAHCVVPDGNEKLSVAKFESENDEDLPVSVVKMIPHPTYDSQSWPASDIGVIKTTRNIRFTGQFKLSVSASPWWGKALLFGAGRTDALSPSTARTSGSNTYLRIGAVLFFLSRLGRNGANAAIAPNDSGAPVTNQDFEIIAVATTTTAKESSARSLPILSTATSVTSNANREFILAHLGLKP